MRLFKKHIVEFKNGKFAIRKRILGISCYLDIDDGPRDINWRLKSNKYFNCCVNSKQTIDRVMNELNCINQEKYSNKIAFRVKKIHN